MKTKDQDMLAEYELIEAVLKGYPVSIAREDGLRALNKVKQAYITLKGTPSNEYKHKVYEIEHDSWSGADYTSKYFDTKEQAMEFVKTTNNKNTAPTAPEYYVVAEYVGIVTGKMLDGKFEENK